MSILKRGTRYPLSIISFTYTCSNDDCKFSETIEGETAEKEKLCTKCNHRMNLVSGHTDIKKEKKQ